MGKEFNWTNKRTAGQYLMTDGYLKTCGDFSVRHGLLILMKTYKNCLL